MLLWSPVYILQKMIAPTLQILRMPSVFGLASKPADPQSAPQTEATQSTAQNRMHNPAAYGMAVCGYHGAKKPTAIKRSANHPQYRHGREALEAKAERSKRLAELRELEALSYAYGLVPAGTPRWRGRKPKA